MKQYQYIFWDLDGTIINSYEGVINCLNYALKQFGIQIEDREIARKFIGPPLRESLPKYAGISENQVEEVVRIYRERYIPIGVFECELFPDVAETIDRFRKAGKIQVLSSSKPEGQCHDVLRKVGLEDKMDLIVGASLDGRIDTKIQVLNEAFRRLEERDPSFAREKVVLIGDTRYDAIGAREAGIDCIGITYGFGTREELIEHGVIAVYDDLPLLARDLEKIS